MKIAIVGNLTSRQQRMVDKLAENPDIEVVYFDHNSLEQAGLMFDQVWINECEPVCAVQEDTSWYSAPEKKVKKPYYRQKDRW